MTPHINILLEELTLFFSDATKEEYRLTKEDVGLLLAYIPYLRQIESHVKNSISNDILSPYGFRQHG